MSRGWVTQAVGFFAELEQHNEREWWAANRGVYDALIKPAFVALLDDISGFDAWRVYRPNNDTRFGSAKGAYKTFIGAASERTDGVGAFVQVSARGLLVGTGMPMPAADQLQRLRTALDDEESGEAFRAVVEHVGSVGGRVLHGRWDPLRRVPRGYSADHPRAEFLRWKGVEIGHRDARPTWLDGHGASAKVDEMMSRGEPLHAWLARHVGPSDLTPEERFAPRSRQRPT